MNEPIGYEQRREQFTGAVSAANAAAAVWLDARAGNKLTRTVESDLDEALRKLRAATKRLEQARRRLGKNISEPTILGEKL